MSEQHKKVISKLLSLVLRHKPEGIGLQLDNNGWADVNELLTKLEKKNVEISMNELKEIVETNDKKRFVFNEDSTRIRANQGHSIEIDLALTPTPPPAFLYHGTAEKNLNSIFENGIQKMNRQHVHLSKDKETALKVGLRHGKALVLTILSGQMQQDGIDFYQSENGVWLTDFVATQYIST